MKFTSTFTPIGILSIEKRWPDGKQEKIFTEENVIVKGGKLFMLSILYTDGIANNVISTLRIGTGGTADPEGLFPKLEDPAWTALNHQILSVATTFTNDVTIPSVTYLADIDQSQANGQLITEAGLFCASGLMFNIKTFPGVPKTAEFSLHFSWTIQIA